MFEQTPHILVIDDNEEILEILILLFKRKGYLVTAQPMLQDVVKEIKVINPDLILLDKSLGWADGTDLCRAIKKEPLLHSKPVIMFSAYHMKKAECLAAGADDFVEKPFAIAELLNAVAAF